MFLQRSKNIQIISKVAVVELYNKMVQQQFIYLFRLAWGFDLFPMVLENLARFRGSKLYIVARLCREKII